MIVTGGFRNSCWCRGCSRLAGILRRHPGQSPLKVGEHVLHCLGPLLLAVELDLDGEGVAGGGVLDLPFLHLVGQTEARVPPLNLLLHSQIKLSYVFNTRSNKIKSKNRYKYETMTRLTTFINRVQQYHKQYILLINAFWGSYS